MSCGFCFLIQIYVYSCFDCMYVCVRMWYPLELELQVGDVRCVLGIELQSFGSTLVS